MGKKIHYPFQFDAFAKTACGIDNASNEHTYYPTDVTCKRCLKVMYSFPEMLEASWHNETGAKDRK